MSLNEDIGTMFNAGGAILERKSSYFEGEGVGFIYFPDILFNFLSTTMQSQLYQDLSVYRRLDGTIAILGGNGKLNKTLIPYSIPYRLLLPCL